MKSFLFAVIKNLLAFMAALAIFLVLCFFLIGFLVSFFVEKPLVVKSNSFLLFNLSTEITDAPKDEFSGPLLLNVLGRESPSTASLLEVLHALNHAAESESIKGLVIKGSLSSGGLPMLREIRQGIENFKKSGKPVVAYLENANKYDYYLASIADHIILNPFAQIRFQGMAIEHAYFADTLKKYGVGVQSTRVGVYKSAIEPFTESRMSDASREQTEAIVNGMWDDLLEVISKSRRTLTTDTLDQLSKQYGILSALDAKKFDLVDELGYYDSMVSKLKQILSRSGERKTVLFVALSRYARSMDSLVSYNDSRSSQSAVAVMYVDGEIVDGGGKMGEIGSDRLSKQLRKVREDKSINAVVLRINSPGGSAYGSEVIQRELFLLNQIKPVVVSFGNYAASGGYWIACYGRSIFADPMTVTGSIGVFGLAFNVEDGAKKLGITFDGVKNGPFADLNSFYHPKTKEQMKLLQQQTDFVYDAFLAKISERRGIAIDEVKELAEGRAWLAKDVKQHGLVDQFGGMQEAIKYAVKLAELDKGYQLIQIPHRSDFVRDLVDTFRDSPDAIIVNALGIPHLKVLQEDINFMRFFNDPQNIYARMPYKMKIW